MKKSVNIIISDTGPLIALAKSDTLFILHKLFQKVFIPDAVFKELHLESYKKGVDLLKKAINEDKKIQDYIKDLIDKESENKYDANSIEKPNWHKNRSWWIEIILAFIISGILYLILGSSIIIIFNNTMTSAIYLVYLIIEFFIQAIIILFIIVILEYFILFKFLK